MFTTAKAAVAVAGVVSCVFLQPQQFDIKKSRNTLFSSEQQADISAKQFLPLPHLTDVSVN